MHVNLLASDSSWGSLFRQLKNLINKFCIQRGFLINPKYILTHVCSTFGSPKVQLEESDFLSTFHRTRCNLNNVLARALRAEFRSRFFECVTSQNQLPRVFNPVFMCLDFFFASSQINPIKLIGSISDN